MGLLIGMLSVRIGSFALTLGCGAWRRLARWLGVRLAARAPAHLRKLPSPAAQQTLSDIGLGGFIAAIGLANGPAALTAIQPHGVQLLSLGVVVTLVPLTIATIVAHRVLHLNPVIICGALAGSDDIVDAAVTGVLRNGRTVRRRSRGCCVHMRSRKRTPHHPFRPCNSCTHLRRVMLPARG